MFILWKEAKGPYAFMLGIFATVHMSHKDLCACDDFVSQSTPFLSCRGFSWFEPVLSRPIECITQGHNAVSPMRLALYHCAPY